MKKIAINLRLFVFSIMIAILVIVSYITLDPLTDRDGAPSVVAATRDRPDHSRISPSQRLLKQDQPTDFRDTVKTIVLTDVLDALASIDEIADPSAKEARYLELCEVWSLQDPAAYFAWVMAQVSPQRKFACLHRGIATLCNAGRIEDALTLIKDVPRGEYRDGAITAGITAISTQNSDKALELILSLSGSGAVSYCATKYGAMLGASSDTSLMESSLDKVPYGIVRDVIQTAMISKIAETSPQTAFSWLNDHDVKDSQAMKAIVLGFISKNILEGINIAQEMRDPKLREKYLDVLSTTWARHSPDDCGAWLRDSVNGEGYALNKRMFEMAIPEIVQLDHERAFQAIKEIKNSKDREIATITAARALARYDPATAANKIMPILDFSSQKDLGAVAEITTNWLVREPLAASKWISELPGGPLKDDSIGRLISNIMENDKNYEMAGQWASQITSLDKRNEVLMRIKKLNNKD